MTPLSILRWLVESSFLIVLGAVCTEILLILVKRFPHSFSPTITLLLSRVTLLASLLLPIATTYLPTQSLLAPRVQVWTEKYKVNAPATFTLTRPLHTQNSSIPLVTATRSDTQRLIFTFFSAWILGMGVMLLHYMVSVFRLSNMLEKTWPWKTVCSVQLRWADSLSSAFSTTLGKTAWVVLPTRYLEHPDLVRASVAHELQHLRNKDTLWAHGTALLKTLFYFHPVFWWWIQRLNLLQEWACDYALTTGQAFRTRLREEPHAYARCLLQAAQLAQGASLPIGTGTTLMAGSTASHHLRQRIELIMMKAPRSKTNAFKRSPTWVLALFPLALLATAAYAARSWVQDRTLTSAQVEKALLSHGVILKNTPQDLSREVHIELTPSVMKQINRFAGTLEGRKFAKQALERMPRYRTLIETHLKEKNFPAELLAVPLIESGYQNHLRSSQQAAGLWQFIPKTAQKYGLTVNDQEDERLIFEKETQAAMAYYGDLIRQFKDWRLVLKAYNEGEKQVQSLIDTHGTRDPWVLESKSSRESYLSVAIAGMILVKAPELLN